ncbi:hypothetical protein [Streptomyces sp. NBC_01465]|uniref:hypothetical protein n=1 Tax=Streptomyces sp. NBC_01465 TaxID=2903878 RepID=UPI002E31618D|nr:hypothetical protein [Streptomyces sp. NBC_01465]
MFSQAAPGELLALVEEHARRGGCFLHEALMLRHRTHRYLRTPDADRYITQEALDLLAGLLGDPISKRA